MHRNFVLWVSSCFGVVSVVSASPSSAAILRQNFELTVTGSPSIIREAQPGAAQNAVFPSIGTTGLGSFVYDESQIRVGTGPGSPGNYTLGASDISDFSLNFFNRTYTQANALASRVGPFLTFDLNAAGQYVPESLYLGTSVPDGSSGLVITGGSFSYGQGGEEYFGTVGGEFRFTESEPIPEPTTAIASSLAAGFGYLFHRRRQRKRQ